MFTLRFIRDGGQTVVSCVSYTVDDFLGDQAGPHIVTGAIVTAYPGLSQTGGVEFRVGGAGGAEPHIRMDSCFVENAAGKTIARIGPFGTPLR